MCGPRAVGRADRCCYCCTGVTFCRRRHPAAPRRLRRPPSRACDENGVTASRRQASGQVASHALGRGLRQVSFTPKRSTQTAQLGRSIGGNTSSLARCARAPKHPLGAPREGPGPLRWSTVGSPAVSAMGLWPDPAPVVAVFPLSWLPELLRRFTGGAQAGAGASHRARRGITWRAPIVRRRLPRGVTSGPSLSVGTGSHVYRAQRCLVRAAARAASGAWAGVCMYRDQDGVWGALFAGHARPDALLAGNSPSGSVFHVRLSLRCAASQSPPPALPRRAPFLGTKVVTAR